MRRSKLSFTLDQLIGANKERIRDCETECLSCFEIDTISIA